MKKKALLLIAGAAIVTLSFSFATSHRSHKHTSSRTTENARHNEPVGGFASEDKF